MRIILRLVAVFSIGVSTCLLFGCFSVIPQSPPSPLPREITEISGKVSMPAYAAVQLGELSVMTSFGNFNVADDGTFRATVTRELPQLLIVVDKSERPVLLALSGVSENLVIDSYTTAYTLLLLFPGLGLADFSSAKFAIQFFSSLSSFKTLVESIEAHLRAGGTFDHPSSEITNALERCINEIIEGCGSPQPQSVLPSNVRSGIMVDVMNNLSPSDLRFRLINAYKRFVELWGAPLGPSGDLLAPLAKVNPGLMKSAESLSFGSLLRGEFIAHSEDIKITLPADAVAYRIEIWGPGLEAMTSVSWDEYWERAKYATFCTFLFDFVGPVLDMTLGLRLLTRGPGRPTDIFRCFQGVIETAHLAGILKKIVLEGKLVSGLIDLIVYLIKDPRPHQALLCFGADLGATLLESSLTWLERKVLVLIITMFKAVDLGRFSGSLILAKPRETFTVTYMASPVNLWIYVRDTGISKGWNWLILPNGEFLELPACKYMQIEKVTGDITIGKSWRVRFEDLSEEVEPVDWDYRQPVLTVQELNNEKVLVTGSYFSGSYKHDLYWASVRIYEDFGAGTFSDYGQWLLVFALK